MEKGSQTISVRSKCCTLQVCAYSSRLVLCYENNKSYHSPTTGSDRCLTAFFFTRLWVFFVFKVQLSLPQGEGEGEEGAKPKQRPTMKNLLVSILHDTQGDFWNDNRGMLAEFINTVRSVIKGSYRIS